MRLNRINKRLSAVANMLSLHGPEAPTLAQVVKQLLSSEALAREIIAKMPSGIAVVDTDGSVLFHNQAAAPLVTREPDLTLRLRCRLPEELEDEVDVSFEQDGQLHVGAISKQTIDWHGRKALLVRLLDRTRERAAEVELRSVLQKSMELNELKSTIIATASHEFRTPLTSIQSSAQLLETYCQEAPVELQAALMRHLTRVQQSVKRMTGLLDDILLLARGDAGKLGCQPSPTDIDALCREQLETAAAIAPDTIELVYQVNELPERIEVDEKLLDHIVSNLLSNAIKYSPQGGKVTLSVACSSTTLTVSVSDQGMGIPAEELDAILTEFYRASNAAAMAGTGLGLTIVNRCIKAHGGELDISSRLRQGSRFTVRIPLSSQVPT